MEKICHQLPENEPTPRPGRSPLSRRGFLKMAGAAGLGLATMGLPRQAQAFSWTSSWYYSVSIAQGGTDWVDYNRIMWNDTGVTQWVTGYQGYVNQASSGGLSDISFYLVSPDGTYTFNGNHECCAMHFQGTNIGQIGQTFPGGVLIPPGYGFVWQVANLGSGTLGMQMNIYSTSNSSGMSVQKWRRDVFTDYHTNAPTFPADGVYHLPITGEGEAPLDMNCRLKQIQAFVSFGGSSKYIEYDISIYRVTGGGTWYHIVDFPHGVKQANSGFISPPPLTGLDAHYDQGDRFWMQSQAKATGGGTVSINVSVFGYFIQE